MELSWSTFVLEIVNFLVLLWILKRFFYEPVLKVISRRQAGIEKTLADAKTLHADAERAQEHYEARLADWDLERRQAREALDRDLGAERVLKLAELQSALKREQEMARVADARRQADAMIKIEEVALLQGARFATDLLEQASGPDMEARLVELVIAELNKLSADRITALHTNYGKTPETIVVVSVFQLSDDQRQRLEHALAAITGPNRPLRFEQNSDLLAGVRIIIGAWVLGLNLQDELKGFVELAYGEKRIGHGNESA